MSDISIREDTGLPALLDMVEQVEAQVAVVTTREEIESGLALVAALETKAKLQASRISAAGCRQRASTSSASWGRSFPRAGWCGQ